MRLLPRFSLRTALLALTIFLIGFGVGGSYWKRYQEHELAVDRLIAEGYNVQVEEETICGVVVGKRIVSLITNWYGPKEPLAAFLALPRPQDLRNFACVDARITELPDQLLDKLRTCTNLERLHLGGQTKQLDGKFLQSFPKLKKLFLRYTTFDFGQLAQAELPELQLLRVEEDRQSRLRLDPAALSRFPKLECLSFVACEYDEVVIAPGVMPQLRVLDLSTLGRAAKIDWDHVVRAFPNLQGLGMHQAQYSSRMNARLDKLPALREFCLCKEDRRDFNTFQLDFVVVGENQDFSIMAAYVPEIQQLQAQRPELKLLNWPEMLDEKYNPREYPYDQHFPEITPPGWLEHSFHNPRML